MREFIRLFAKILNQLMIQNRELKYINKQLGDQMATLQDLKDQIAEIETAVEADVAQDIKVIAAIDALLKALENAGNHDFQAEVNALKAASSKLSSDNQAVQDAIDKTPA